MEFVPIGVAILSLALALWRASALWQRTLNARAFDSAVSRLIVAGNKERALKLCRAAPKSVIANAARACLEQELAFGNDKPPTRPEQLKFAFDGAIARGLRSLARQAPWAWLAIGGAAIALGLVLREDSFRVATIIVSSGAVICAAWSIVTHRRLQSACLASQQRVLSALVDGQVFVAKTSVSGPVARMTKGALSLAVVGQALPSFWFALILIFWFGIVWRLLPITGTASWLNFVMPSIALGYYVTPGVMRLTRAGM